MKFGLKESTLEKIINVIVSAKKVDQAILYGSRAKGNNRQGSDIDISLKGENISIEELNRISLDLDDLLLPYTFDLSIYEHIKNPDLIDHINRVGIILYTR